jgi:hypothetical protein
MDETTADRLAIAATQLDMTTDRIFQDGVTAEDLARRTQHPHDAPRRHPLRTPNRMVFGGAASR